jgi:tripartite-type tricarboxylate transporter receptor subunit TctC
MKNRKREICTSGSVRDEAGQPPHLLGRRKFLHLAASAAALPAVSRVARAQAYPTRPVRIVVGFTPGGAVDITARLIAHSLSERLGQPFTIENRPGAATNIGTDAVIRAPADGYTLLMISPPAAINATLYENLTFNFIRDIAPVASVIRMPFVLEVNPFVPAKTVPELIAFARTNPGKISMASSGIGSGPHLAGELFKMMAGINMVHVPYRGEAPAMNDLLGGQVQVLFGTTALATEHIRAGKVRALALTTPTRAETLPGIPILSNFLPGYEASFWDGFCAPKNTPAEVIERLNKEINAALTDPQIKARFSDMGGSVFAGSPADFGKFIAEETEKWGKVIRAANIKPE